MKSKKILLILFIAVIGIFGIINVDAATICDDGKYTLILTSNEEDFSIDGESKKVIKFNVDEGETTVKLSELTNKVVPFNGRTEFAYWGSFSGEKIDENISITEFSWSGNIEGEPYTNGLTLYAKFSDKVLQGTGTYYLTLDMFGGKFDGHSSISITSKSTEFKTVDLTKYTPVREGYTFVGWDLNGKYVTSIDSSYFAKQDCITVTATYVKNTLDDDYRVLVLDANGGTIDGKLSNKYDYVGGANSGTSMSLLPYIPVREGYTFNGWNSKKDGSGKAFKYIYWRAWDKENETDVEKDNLISDESGYEYYKNVTLYATWTKNSSDDDTVKEIENTTGIKTIISFDEEVSKDYTLDIKQIDIKKELADKNIKFLVDINVLEGDNIIKINNIKMKIKIALPDNLKGYSKYQIVYIDNNEVKETIPAKVENGYIVFETSHLSQYGIVATSIANPNTSDNVISYIAISALTLLGLTAVVVKRNKQTI